MLLNFKCQTNQRTTYILEVVISRFCGTVFYKIPCFIGCYDFCVGVYFCEYVNGCFLLFFLQKSKYFLYIEMVGANNS